MEFNTPYSRLVSPPEENHGETVVETAGYVPAKDQIESLMLAGRRLAEFRKEQYDFGPDQEVDDSFDDPTRSPNYDMADAHQDSLALTERLKKAKVRAEAKEAAKVASEAAETVSEAKKDVPGTSGDTPESIRK